MKSIDEIRKELQRKNDQVQDLYMSMGLPNCKTHIVKANLEMIKIEIVQLEWVLN